MIPEIEYVIFFDAIQNLEIDKVSQIISTSSGFYIARLKERIQPERQEFEEKKEDFIEDLLEAKKQEHFSQFLTELKNKPNTFLNASEPSR